MIDPVTPFGSLLANVIVSFKVLNGGRVERDDKKNNQNVFHFIKLTKAHSFSAVKYSEKADTLSDRYMHLTNYSINKLSSNYSANEDASACQGHKWTVKSLFTYLDGQGVNTKRLWGAMRSLVLRTILAGEHAIYNMYKVNVGSKYNCFELFGIDVILDAELKPWLLEVNISPSLHSASPLDLYVKGPLVTALLNTTLYQVPPKLTAPQQHEILKEQGLKGKKLCYDKRLYVTSLSKPERIKHSQFAQKNMPREDVSPVRLSPTSSQLIFLSRPLAVFRCHFRKFNSRRRPLPDPNRR